MIKVNLLPVKKKKKQKPIPGFLLGLIGLTVLTVLVLAYAVFFFSSRLSDKKAKFRENEAKIAELKKKIQAVEDFEKRNAIFLKRKEVIEQLGKNKALPVKVIDEISRLLPPGVWLTSMDVKGNDINLGCTAFTNTDVVNYVNNLKGSQLFTDVYLKESVQSLVEKIQVYNFSLTFKVKQ